MPPYRHLFRCRKCDVFSSVQLATLSKDTNDAPAVLQGKVKRFQHFEVQSGGCQTYLSYVSSTDLAAAAPNLANQLNTRKIEARNKSKAITRNPSAAVACALYDPLTDDWYYGVSGPHLPQGNIRANIYAAIPATSNPPLCQWGRGCAEVMCISAMYAARNLAQRAQDLTGCVFSSYERSKASHRKFCNGCNGWIPRFGGIDAFV